MSTGTGTVRVRIAGWSSEELPTKRKRDKKAKTKPLLMKEKKMN
jgi:hypothetical protein